MLNSQIEVPPPTDTRVRARSTPIEDALTIAASLWLVVGLFLDGYAHEHFVDGDESFLSPWHGVFYSGFAASVAVIAWMARRRSGIVRAAQVLPPGYRSVPNALALFGLGGLGDALWHAGFGVERGIDALLSPTHLLLFAALLVMLGAPFRAASSQPQPGSPTWRTSWPGLGSLLLAAALVGFFLNFAWGLGNDALIRVAYDPVTETGEEEVIAALASTLVATGVLFGSALLLMRKGLAARGSFTMMFGAVALLIAVAFEEGAAGVGAALAGGLALDVLVRTRTTPSPVAGTTRRAFTLAPAVMWLTYYLLARFDGPIAWQPELWLGSLVLNALAGFALWSISMEPTLRS